MTYIDSPEIAEMRSRIVEPFPQVIGVRSGWHKLLVLIHNKLLEIDADYKLYQVKEKFGALRVYVSSDGDENKLAAMNSVINRYSNISMFVCEECGKPGRLRRKESGWYFTACPVHSHEYPPVPMNQFVTPNQETNQNQTMFLEDFIYALDDVFFYTEMLRKHMEFCTVYYS